MRAVLDAARLLVGGEQEELRVHRMPVEPTCEGWTYEAEAHLRGVIFDLWQENFYLKQQVEKLLANSTT